MAVKPRVLVTRPEPGASRTAARLAAAGFEPVVLPLTRIEQLECALPEGSFDAVIITSAQALNGAGPAGLQHLPIFAVGETTADCARAAGFSAVLTARGSVESIADLVRKSAKPAARLLYLCGKVRRPELEAALTGAGFLIAAVETYDAMPIVYSERDAAARLGGAAFDAVTLMSAQAAEHFSALAEAADIAPVFAQSAIICISHRIADALTAQDGGKISVSAEPSESSMLALLQAKLL